LDGRQRKLIVSDFDASLYSPLLGRGRSAIGLKSGRKQRQLLANRANLDEDHINSPAFFESPFFLLVSERRSRTRRALLNAQYRIE
jgi:hypothetical protein